VPGSLIEAPTDVVMSFVTPERALLQADVVRHFCHFVRFFASAPAAEVWIHSHVGTFLLRLEEAWRLARLKIAARYPSMGAAEGARASDGASRSG